MCPQNFREKNGMPPQSWRIIPRGCGIKHDLMILLTENSLSVLYICSSSSVFPAALMLAKWCLSKPLSLQCSRMVSSALATMGRPPKKSRRVYTGHRQAGAARRMPQSCVSSSTVTLKVRLHWNLSVPPLFFSCLSCLFSESEKRSAEPSRSPRQPVKKNAHRSPVRS